MRFQPKTEQEVAGDGVWPASEVDFEILEATETVSKTGNEMIKLRVRIYNAEGRSKTLFDYLVATEGWAYKVRHFAEAQRERCSARPRATEAPSTPEGAARAHGSSLGAGWRRRRDRSERARGA